MSIPPLLTPAPLVRGGPALQRVSERAVSYVEQGGLRFEDVYPDDVEMLRAIAPNLMEGGRVSDAARDFTSATGLPFGVVYPEHAEVIVLGEVSEVSGEPRTGRSSGKLRVAATVTGFAIGACLVGPLGAAVGALAAWLAGGRL